MHQDIRQSLPYAHFMKKIGWQVETVATQQFDNGGGNETITVNCFVKKLPVVGSVIKVQRPNWPIPFDGIEQLATDQRAMFVKIEPQPGADPSLLRELTTKYHYQTDHWPLLPTRTIWIDLTTTEEQLLALMDKNTRYSIRQAEKNHFNITITHNTQTSSIINQFIDYWQINAKKRGFWVPFASILKGLWEAFGSQAFVVMASAHTGQGMAVQPLAGALIVTDKRVACYLHAFSTPMGRKLSGPSLVVWQGMLHAKQQGCVLFDLEGIYDRRFDNRTRSWKNFSAFKQGFGGAIIDYPVPIIHKRSAWGILFG